MTHASPLSTERLHQLHDEAHADAQTLRREALADFWRGTDAWLGSAVQRADRSAQRLAQRLRRHRHSGAAATGHC